jgi:GNAT superfamily N-acetyltransferase
MSTIHVARLTEGDRHAWENMARAYKTFYRTELSPASYDETWQRLIKGDGIYAFAARFEGRVVGIVHYLFHSLVWMGSVCYLQDLYVDEAVRGQGAARAMIERVAQDARKRGSVRLYWHTQDGNTRARTLYDKVAQFRGFIRYEHPL